MFQRLDLSGRFFYALAKELGGDDFESLIPIIFIE